MPLSPSSQEETKISRRRRHLSSRSACTVRRVEAHFHHTPELMSSAVPRVAVSSPHVLVYSWPSSSARAASLARLRIVCAFILVSLSLINVLPERSRAVVFSSATMRG
ncbi:hypothetical protein PYCCODRAFT_43420 [Trametes coccinea BRFM310]|uniref:Uncharacterized protein n=1 Tax=Trametes coccinea (strain BRFM310) TaxID=1353009 RepID=A0A1Y2J5I0_TRAC3|nr:hypothetical protein PYCCODRAFT_43420 [Trametes coccinea BRFM310]